MDIKKEIESYIDTCNEYEKKYATNGEYADALYVQGMNYAYKKVLKLLEELEEQEQEKAFSLGKVNIGDEVEYGNSVRGKVVGSFLF